MLPQIRACSTCDKYSTCFNELYFGGVKTETLILIRYYFTNELIKIRLCIFSKPITQIRAISFHTNIMLLNYVDAFPPSLAPPTNKYTNTKSDGFRCCSHLKAIVFKSAV